MNPFQRSAEVELESTLAGSRGVDSKGGPES